MTHIRLLFAAAVGGLVVWSVPATAQESRPGPGGRPDPEQMFKKMDKNQDGKLTKDEIPEAMREGFGRLFERLGKEELTPEDLRGMRDRFGGGGRGQQGDPGQFFDRLDTNKDGTLTLDEVPERAKRMVKPLLERAGKDSVTREEFLKMSRQRGGEGGRPGAGSRPGGSESTEPGQRRRGFGGPGSGQRPGGFGPGGPGPDGPGGFRGPVFFQKLDADKNGKITKEELAKVVELFDQLDVNGDGTLDLRELFGAPMGQGGRPPMGQGRRPQASGDRPQRPEGSRPQRPEASRPDRASGDRPERPREDGGGRGRPSVEQIMQRFDSDSDGKLSKDEVPEKMKENFSRLDANEDGKIDAEELKQGFAKARERGREKL